MCIFGKVSGVRVEEIYVSEDLHFPGAGGPFLLVFLRTPEAVCFLPFSFLRGSAGPGYGSYHL